MQVLAQSVPHLLQQLPLQQEVLQQLVAKLLKAKALPGSLSMLELLVQEMQEQEMLVQSMAEAHLLLVKPLGARVGVQLTSEGTKALALVHVLRMDDCKLLLEVCAWEVTDKKQELSLYELLLIMQRQGWQLLTAPSARGRNKHAGRLLKPLPYKRDSPSAEQTDRKKNWLRPDSKQVERKYLLAFA